MNCIKCGNQLPDKSAFCNSCGTPQLPAPPGQAQEKEPETTLWVAKPSGKPFIKSWILTLAWGLALMILYMGPLKEFAGRSSVSGIVLAVLIAAPCLLIIINYAALKLGTRYKLTTQRFFRTTGILTRRQDEIELIRVDDITVSQPFLDRVFNVGIVTLMSTDATHPRLEIQGVDDPLRVKELIRNQVRKERGRSMFMETL